MQALSKLNVTENHNSNFAKLQSHRLHENCGEHIHKEKGFNSMAQSKIQVPYNVLFVQEVDACGNCKK
jgi:hypothetical protein